MTAEQLDPANTLVITVGLGYEGETPQETGDVHVALLTESAPNHAARLKELARDNFYDGKLFHRVIDGFMAQTGSPRGDGIGGSDKPDLNDEFSDVKFDRGVVGIARTGYNTGNSQFFIMFERAEWLDREYTAVGKVVKGMEVIDRIHRTERNRKPAPGAPDRMITVRVLEDFQD